MEEGKEDGYVKLWRRSLRSDVWQNPKVWRVWCWMLMKATHKQIIQLVGYQSVTLNPGEFIFGRKICSKETKVSEKSVRSCLQALKVANRVAIKNYTKFSVVNIINWDQYQDEDVIRENKKGQQNGHQAAIKRPASGHKQTHKPQEEINRESTSVDSLAPPAPPERHKPCPVDQIVGLYNQSFPSSPKCLNLPDVSRKMLITRWREKAERQNLDWWRKLFEWMCESDFLSGRVGDFVVDFIWIVRPNNFAKILNGNYVNRDKKQAVPKRTQANLQAVSAVEKLIEEGKV